MQTKHSVLRNYPISAHLRFLLEHIRPEMRQYFFESETDGLAVQPQPARGRLSARQDAARQAAVRHAARHRQAGLRMAAPFDGAGRRRRSEPFRITVGGPDCRQPYSASVFNISAMSFGALSANAIRALNRGAKLGGFAHDTGEGGYSPYHQRGRRRHHLGDRLRLFRLPPRRRRVRRGQVRRRRGQSADQDDRDQAEPGRQARPRRRAAGREGDARRSRRSAASKKARTASRPPATARSRRRAK